MKKKDGFLYILRHPDRIFTEYGLSDDEHLFKIGVEDFRNNQLRTYIEFLFHPLDVRIVIHPLSTVGIP